MIKVNCALILTIIEKTLPKTKICYLLLRQDPAQKFAKNVLSPIFWLLGSKFSKSQSRDLVRANLEMHFWHSNPFYYFFGRSKLIVLFFKHL